jgi:hypothetical protein
MGRTLGLEIAIFPKIFLLVESSCLEEAQIPDVLGGGLEELRDK